MRTIVGRRCRDSATRCLRAAVKLKPVIDRTLPMSELPQALVLMGQRQVRGKLVLLNPDKALPSPWEQNTLI